MNSLQWKIKVYHYLFVLRIGPTNNSTANRIRRNDIVTVRPLILDVNVSIVRTVYLKVSGSSNSDLCGRSSRVESAVLNSTAVLAPIYVTWLKLKCSYACYLIYRYHKLLLLLRYDGFNFSFSSVGNGNVNFLEIFHRACSAVKISRNNQYRIWCQIYNSSLQINSVIRSDRQSSSLPPTVYII